MEILKWIRRIFIIFVFVLSYSNASGQLDDILSSSSSSFDFAGVSSLKSQTRGYYNFGGLAVRHDFGGAIRPFHVEAPRLASGCGGVDIGFGGFSFLSIDKLVEKLQKIASAAPAFAFNMALSALCKDCQSIMDQLNAVADSINGLNFDACKSAVSWGKSIGTALNGQMTNADDATSGISSVISNLSGAIKNASDNISSTISCVSTGNCTDVSPDAAKAKAVEKIKFQGSLIDKVFNDNQNFLSATTSGSSTSSTYSYWFGGLSQQNAKALFRNMIGDFYGWVDQESCAAKDGEQGVKNYKVAIIPPRMSADETINVFLGEDSGGDGNLTGLMISGEVDLSAVCGPGHKGKPGGTEDNNVDEILLDSTIRAGTIRRSVEDRLLAILSNMSSLNDPSLKTSANFMSAMRYPVYKALNVASVTHDTLLVGYIADVIVAQELVGLMNELMRKARQFMALIGTTDSTSLFEDQNYKAIEERIVKINEKAAQVRDETMKKMNARVAQISVLDDVSKRFKTELTKKGMYRLGH